MRAMRCAGWVLAVALSGCIGEGDECTKNTDCPRGFVCGAAVKICVRDGAPKVQIDVPATALTQPTHLLQATVTDDVQVLQAELSLDDGATWLPMTLDGERASGEVALPASLDSRPFAVKVRAQDGLSQWTEASASLLVDRVGPQIAITPITQTLGGTEANFAGLVTDGSGTVASVVVTLGDGDVSTTPSTGGWAVRLPLPAGIEGERTLTVRAVDGLGNQAQVTANVRLDTIAPLFTADAGQVVGQGPTLVRFRSNEPVEMVVASWRDAGVPVTVVSTTDFAVTVAAAPGTSVEQLAVRAVDLRGNPGQATLSISADTVPPTFTLGSNQIIGPTPAPVRFTSSKPMASVSARWRDAGVAVVTTSPTEFSVTVGAGPGTTSERLEVEGTDTRGNPGQRALAVDTDTDAPMFVWLSPDAGARLGGDGVVSALLSARVDDPAGVVSVDFDFQDDAGTRSAARDDAGVWTLSVSLPRLDAVSVTVTAQARDALGNVGQAAQGVLIDTVAPTLQFTRPVVDALLGGPAAQVSVAGSAQDPSGIALVRYSLGDAGVNATEVDGGFVASLPLPGGDYAPHQLRASVSDGVGNTASFAQRVFVDRQAPVVSISTPIQVQRLNIAQLAATDGGVMVRCSATDADPQPLVFRGFVGSFDAGIVDGGFIAPTAPTDNGTFYQARVTATDRAGNVGVLDRQYSVDRVAPSVTSLTPATGQRNLPAQNIDVRFSEAVWGPDAGVEVSGSVSTGSWNVGHDGYQAGGFTPYAVVTGTVANLVDTSGNPLVSRPTTSFHLEARAPSAGSGLSTDVRYFDITSDADGVAALAVVTTSTIARLRLYPMDPATGTFGSLAHEFVDFPHATSGFEVQAYRALTGIDPRNRYGLSYFDGLQPQIVAWEAGTSLVGTSEDRSDRLVLSPPQAFDIGSKAIGRFVGADYVRGSGSLVMPYKPNLVTVGDDATWYGWRFKTGQIEFFRAQPSLPAGPFGFRGMSTVFGTAVAPSEESRYAVTAAANATGSCRAIAYTNGSGLKELAMISSTDDGTCTSGCDPVVTQMSAGLFPEVGSFGDSILVAQEVAGSSPREVGLFISGSTAASCTTLRELTKPGTRVPVSSLAPLNRVTHRAYRPVRLGPVPAIVYIDTQRRLAVQYL